MRFFSPKEYTKKSWELVQEALDNGQNRKIETDYFYISIFKKGTIHIEFRDEEALRWFNIEACKRKGWLPMDYAERSFDDMSEDSKSACAGFEGKKKFKFKLSPIKALARSLSPQMLAAA